MARKRNENLPHEVTDAFRSIAQLPRVVSSAYAYLLRDKGWTLRSIGEAADYSGAHILNLTRKIGDEAAARDILSSYSVETLPIPTPTRRSTSPKTLPPEMMAKLNQLHLFAAARSGTKYMSEAEEYTAILWHAHSQYGMSVYRLAQLLDVGNAAIYARFVRYGYTTTTGSSAALRPLKNKTTAD